MKGVNALNKPFLKWAGSKTKLTPLIAELLPSGKRLVEPFLGSGAVFLNTNYDNYLLCDINEDVIHLYQCLQEDIGFIDVAYTYFKDNIYNNSEDYYRLRTRFNELKQSEHTYDVKKEKSAIFLYLNRHGFNGLCRYNASGGYNVPFGKYKQPYFPQKEMEFFHEKAQCATFATGDFSEILQHHIKEGDVVYADPPYAPLDDQQTNFTTYASGGFGFSEQKKLAEFALTLRDKEIPVLLSNHDSSFTRELYKEAQITSIEVQRFINSDGANRNKVGEVLALFS